jgi:hypothetical protein
MPFVPRLSAFARISSLFPALAAASFAADMPKGFAEKRVAEGLSSPSALAVARDGRVFIAQQQGQVRLIKNDSLLARPFLTLTNVDGSQERGLLGIALDPGFDTNQYVYVYYTAAQPTLHNRLGRFTARGDTADPATDTVLLSLPTLPYRSGTTYAYWHMGGGIEFGPDGKIYIGVGDHESPNSASDLASPFGKILRANRDGSAPADNPYADSLSGLSRYIHARGFRNPFTIAVHRATGRVFANDVGNGSWESVDSVVRGGHYGWRTYEGAAFTPGFVDPLHAYSRNSSEYSGCAVIGGDFYQPDTVRFAAADTGKYFFTDFCQGWILKADSRTGEAKAFASGLSYPTGLKFDRGGNLYYLSRDYPTGGIQEGASSAWKITGGQDTTPAALSRPRERRSDQGRAGLRHAHPGARWLVPPGATRLRVRDLSGRLLWEAASLVGGARVVPPEALGDRVVWVRWE